MSIFLERFDDSHWQLVRQKRISLGLAKEAVELQDYPLKQTTYQRKGGAENWTPVQVYKEWCNGDFVTAVLQCGERQVKVIIDTLDCPSTGIQKMHQWFRKEFN